MRNNLALILALLVSQFVWASANNNLISISESAQFLPSPACQLLMKNGNNWMQLKNNPLKNLTFALKKFKNKEDTYFVKNKNRWFASKPQCFKYKSLDTRSFSQSNKKKWGRSALFLGPAMWSQKLNITNGGTNYAINSSLYGGLLEYRYRDNLTSRFMATLGTGFLLGVAHAAEDPSASASFSYDASSVIAYGFRALAGIAYQLSESFSLGLEGGAHYQKASYPTPTVGSYSAVSSPAVSVSFMAGVEMSFARSYLADIKVGINGSSIISTIGIGVNL